MKFTTNELEKNTSSESVPNDMVNIRGLQEQIKELQKHILELENKNESLISYLECIKLIAKNTLKELRNN